MAEQKGPIKALGKVGDLTGYQRGDKFFFRRTSNLDKARVSTDPAFANSRKAAARFKQANALGARIREAVEPPFKIQARYANNTNIVSALTKAVQACPLVLLPASGGHRGRPVESPDLRHFAKPQAPFQLNPHLSAMNCFPGRKTVTREGDIVTITLSPLSFPKHLNKNKSATHVRFFFIAAPFGGSQNAKTGTAAHAVSHWSDWHALFDDDEGAIHQRAEKALSIQHSLQVPGANLQPFTAIAVGIQAAEFVNRLPYDLVTLTALDVVAVLLNTREPR